MHVALGRGALPPDPVLFRLAGLPLVQQQLYDLAEFAEVRPLPWDDATPAAVFPGAQGFGRTVDLRDFVFDPAFRGAAMIDYFLSRLDVDPTTVASAEKRNTWLAPRIVPELPRGGPGYVLICARSSMKLRDMDDIFYAAACRWVLRRGYVLRSLVEVDSLAALCGEVAGAALIVSTDTAIVHLADALSVPCLAFFPTHRPEVRVRDYPLCRAIRLSAPNLPDGLEFSRGPADLAAVREAWLPHGEDMSWLEEILATALP